MPTFEIANFFFAAVAVSHVFADGSKLYAVEAVDGPARFVARDGFTVYPNVHAAEVKVNADGAPVYITDGDFFFNARKDGLSIA